MDGIFSKEQLPEIIDFHTHPYSEANECICAYKNEFELPPDKIRETMKGFGISGICGSVIHNTGNDIYENVFERIKAENRSALRLRDEMQGFYIPGIHIHPDYPEESVAELGEMNAQDVKLIGELVPYMHGWNSYASEKLNTILKAAGKYSMVVSFHEMASDTVDAMLSANPDVMFVAAHPGERPNVEAHAERMLRHDNICLDISGTGIFRYHAIRYLVDRVGSDRILFGTDFPICNPGVYIGGVLAEPLRDFELENIFANNAKRLLGI